METILDKEVHARLIADIDHICGTASIDPRFVHKSMVGTCGAGEIDWVRNFRKYRSEGVAGLAMVGVDNENERQRLMCGALLRNFIDARVVPLNQLLILARKDSLPEPTVLLIPNLFIKPVGPGKQFYASQLQILHDVLVARQGQDKPTVVYVEDMDGMRAAYGAPIADLIEQHYKIVKE